MAGHGDGYPEYFSQAEEAAAHDGDEFGIFSQAQSSLPAAHNLSASRVHMQNLDLNSQANSFPFLDEYLGYLQPDGGLGGDLQPDGGPAAGGDLGHRTTSLPSSSFPPDDAGIEEEDDNGSHMVLDLHEMKNAGDRLISALSLPRYRHLKVLNLEFAQDIEDRHFIHLKEMSNISLGDLEFLNLNACQKISDKGVEAVSSLCPNLRGLSIYWMVGLTDSSIVHITKNCKQILDLNLSGCKNISDKGMWLIANNYQGLKKLNITRCVKLTENGLQEVLQKCSSLESLNLYALSSFTDKVYKEIGSLAHLTFLDLCGAQNLTDDGLACISKCGGLTYLNLTWCVRVTDVGVIAIAQGCQSLELLSLFGIVGVTDACLEALSKSCQRSLTTLDIGIKRRSRDELLKLFPLLSCFKVHS